MVDPGHSANAFGREHVAHDLEHPRGTLVIVILFGLLFGLAWISMYLFQFLERGVPHS